MNYLVRTGCTSGYADCVDCSWTSHGKNAVGLAAIHAGAFGHHAGAVMEYACIGADKNPAAKARRRKPDPRSRLEARILKGDPSL